MIRISPLLTLALAFSAYAGTLEISPDEVVLEPTETSPLPPYYTLGDSVEPELVLHTPAAEMPLVLPGFGRPGKLESYEVSEELAARMKPYGFEAGWFRRGPVAWTGEALARYNQRVENWKARKEKRPDCVSCTVERIPYLFRPAAQEGPLPLVVYVPGNGEQGEDLVKQFRQTGVMDAVSGSAFQAAHPCQLLVVMPPDFANCSAYYGGNPKATYRDLQQMYADLIFQLARERAKIDLRKVVLVGLGSGATAADAMAFDYPGRFAGVNAVFTGIYVEHLDARRPGRWWIGTCEAHRDYHETTANYTNLVVQAGGEVKWTWYPQGGCWWDKLWRSPEFTDWLARCFEKGVIYGKGSETPMVLPATRMSAAPVLLKTGPHTATYYSEVGTRYHNPPGEPFTSWEGIRTLNVVYATEPLPSRICADAKDLSLVLVSKDFHGFATDAFEGCSPKLTLLCYGDGKWRDHTAPQAMTNVFARVLYYPDDLRHADVFCSEDFLWTESGVSARVLRNLGSAPRCIIPETLNGKPVVELGWSVPRADIADYEEVFIPRSVKTIKAPAQYPHIRTLRTDRRLGDEFRTALSAESTVCSTVEATEEGGALDDPGFKGKQVVLRDAPNFVPWSDVRAQLLEEMLKAARNQAGGFAGLCPTTAKGNSVAEEAATIRRAPGKFHIGLVWDDRRVAAGVTVKMTTTGEDPVTTTGVTGENGTVNLVGPCTPEMRLSWEGGGCIPMTNGVLRPQQVAKDGSCWGTMSIPYQTVRRQAVPSDTLRRARVLLADLEKGPCDTPWFTCSANVIAGAPDETGKPPFRTYGIVLDPHAECYFSTEDWQADSNPSPVRAPEFGYGRGRLCLYDDSALPLAPSEGTPAFADTPEFRRAPRGGIAFFSYQTEQGTHYGRVTVEYAEDAGGSVAPEAPVATDRPPLLTIPRMPQKRSLTPVALNIVVNETPGVRELVSSGKYVVPPAPQQPAADGPETLVLNEPRELAEGAYANRRDLRTVVLGPEVESVGAGAFTNCWNLRTVICAGAKLPQIGARAFAGTRPDLLLVCRASEATETSYVVQAAEEPWRRRTLTLSAAENVPLTTVRVTRDGWVYGIENGPTGAVARILSTVSRAEVLTLPQTLANVPVAWPRGWKFPVWTSATGLMVPDARALDALTARPFETILFASDPGARDLTPWLTETGRAYSWRRYWGEGPGRLQYVPHFATIDQLRALKEGVPTADGFRYLVCQRDHDSPCVVILGPDENLRTAREIVVPERIGGLRVKEIASRAFARLPNLERLAFPDLLYHFGDGVCYGCPKLQDVKIPERVIHNNEDWSFSFLHCPVTNRPPASAWEWQKPWIFDVPKIR